MLLVDASEGPLPHDALRAHKASAAGPARPGWVINKNESSLMRGLHEVLNECTISLSIWRRGAEDQLGFPLLYTNSTSERLLPTLIPARQNLRPLSNAILGQHAHPPPAVNAASALQIRVRNLDYITTWPPGIAVCLTERCAGPHPGIAKLDGSLQKLNHQLFSFRGLKRVDLDSRVVDIVAMPCRGNELVETITSV